MPNDSSSYLLQCIKIYQGTFAPGWVDCIFSSDVDPQLGVMTALSIIEDSFTKNCYIALCKSQISGEYLEFEKFQDDMQVLREGFSLEAMSTFDDINKETVVRELENSLLELQKVLSQYYEFAHSVNNKIKISNRELLFKAHTVDFLLKNKYFHFFSSSVLNFSALEHFLSNEPEYINRLIMLEESFEMFQKETESSDTQFIYRIFRDKIFLLLRKALRKEPSYTFNFEEKSLDLNSINVSSLKTLAEYVDMSVASDLAKYSNKSDKWQRSLYNEEYRLSYFVLLIRHYKDVEKDYSQTSNLVNSFNKLYDMKFSDRTALSEFDKYSYYTVKNFLLNCNFSMFVSESSSDFLGVKEEIEKICTYQKETRVYNFYPYQKCIIFLIEDIDKYFTKEDVNVTEINERLDFFQKMLDKLENALKWSKEYKFYPFQLPFDECLFKYEEDSDLNIFVPSTFSKPINYKTLKDNLDSYKFKFNMFKSQLSILARLNTEKKHLIDIRNEMKSFERKNLEQLGVFTAVITFLFGAVQLFSNAKTFKDLLASTSVLGVIILLFSSSIYFLTMKREDSWGAYFGHPRFLFFLVFSFIYSFILYLAFNQGAIFVSFN
ncbi:hypothetical protein [Bacteroides graminisolvens]